MAHVFITALSGSQFKSPALPVVFDWIVKRKTAKDRFTRALRGGHFQYYYIRGNSFSIGCFYQEVYGRWRKWLNRRSKRARMTLERFTRLRKIYPLIKPKNAGA